MAVQTVQSSQWWCVVIRCVPMIPVLTLPMASPSGLEWDTKVTHCKCKVSCHGSSSIVHGTDHVHCTGTCPGAPSGLTDTTQSDSDPSNVTVVLEWSPTVGFPAGECIEYTVTEEGSGESQSTSDVSLTWSGLRLCNTYSFTASASAVGCLQTSTSSSVQLGE